MKAIVENPEGDYTVTPDVKVIIIEVGTMIVNIWADKQGLVLTHPHAHVKMKGNKITIQQRK